MEPSSLRSGWSGQDEVTLEAVSSAVSFNVEIEDAGDILSLDLSPVLWWYSNLGKCETSVSEGIVPPPLLLLELPPFSLLSVSTVAAVPDSSELGPELGLELGLAELKLAYFRCLLAGGDLIL